MKERIRTAALHKKHKAEEEKLKPKGQINGMSLEEHLKYAAYFKTFSDRIHLFESFLEPDGVNIGVRRLDCSYSIAFKIMHGPDFEKNLSEAADKVEKFKAMFPDRFEEECDCPQCVEAKEKIERLVTKLV